MFGILIGKNGSMTVSCIKLEKGNIATDWTPAPEDVDEKVEAVQETAEQAAAKLASWCAANNTTYIDGSKIYTGTVTTVQLAASSVTADKISAGAITTDKLAADSVTADKLNVSTLSAITANLGTVTAGTIRSTNYVSGSSGMQLSLSTGVWDSKYFKISSNGTITATAGKIGGFTIGSTTLTSSGGDYTAVLSCYNNDDAQSRVLHCYQGSDSSNDTFRIKRDGTVHLISSQLIVGPSDLANTLACQAGHINFYYGGSRVGQLGIGSILGDWAPVFDGKFGTTGDIVMTAAKKYLYGGGKLLIGASEYGNLVIGKDDQYGDVNVYSGFGVINLYGSVNISDRIYLSNNMYIRGYRTGGTTYTNVVGISDSDNIVLGNASQPGSTHIYAASSKDIKYIIGSTTVGYVDSSGLNIAGKITCTAGLVSNGGATISGVVTCNGLTCQGAVSGYSITTSGGIYLNNNKSVFGKNTSGTNYSLVSMSTSNNARFGSSNLPGNTYLLTSDTGYVNLRCGSQNVLSVNALGMFMPSGSYIMCGSASSFKVAMVLRSSYISVGDETIPLRLYGSTVTSNGSSVSSDARLKNNISPLDKKYEAMLDLLNAKTYRYNNYRQDVTNCGFIAQDVLAALSEAGLTAEEFGGFVDVMGDGSEYALDYAQFIPILWEQVRKLKAEIAQLKGV